MKVHIIVEGVTDKELLEKLLSDLPSHLKPRIEAANGKDAARPFVRKCLLRGTEPTIFVFDTDTTNDSKILEQVRAYQHYFGWGSPRVPFEMFPMVPALEVVFFDRPSVLERRIGTTLEPSIKRAGAHAPKEVLEELLAVTDAPSLHRFYSSLTSEDVKDLCQQETIVRLRQALETMSPTDSKIAG